MKYTGPTIATLSVSEDCIYDTQHERAKNNLDLTILSKCKNSSSFNNEDSYFQPEKCKAAKSGDEKEFIQVKFYDNEYHIYCFGNSYLIGKREVKCHQKVFTLPLSITFTLNEVEYNGNILKVIYREREDPLMMEHVNWHLTPQLNWSDLVTEVEKDWENNEEIILEESKNLKEFEFRTPTGLSTTEIVLISAGTLLGGTWLLICGRIVYLRLSKKDQRRTRTWNAVKEKDPDTGASSDPEGASSNPEVTPLQPVNHLIIVQ